MKKIIMLMVLMLVFSFAACSSDSNTLDLDEMIDAAQELNIGTLRNEIRNNLAKAEEDYVGKYFMYSDFIREIEEDYIAMSEIYVFLPKEEIAKLNRFQMITVVGKIENLTGSAKNQIDILNGENIIEMKDAHFVSDVMEIEGTLVFQDIVMGQQYDNLWYCAIDDGTEIRYGLTNLAEDPLNTIHNDGNVIINGETFDGQSKVQATCTVVCDGINNGITSATSDGISTGRWKADNVQIKEIIVPEIVNE